MKFKKMGTILLAATLAVTQLPTTALAAANISNGDAPKAVAASLAEAKNAKKTKEEKGKYVEGEAIVLFNADYTKKAGTNAVKAMNFSSDITVKNIWSFSNDGDEISKTGKTGIKAGDFIVASVKSDKLSTEKLIAKLKQNPNVEKAEPNYIVKATSTGDYRDYQWALDNQGQNGGDTNKDINADYLWNKNIKGTDRVIAIVDTGVDYTHPDLKDKMWTNTNLSRLPGAHGYDFANGDSDPIDDNGHGTHCSGIMAGATEASPSGISGVNQSAKIMGLKFLDEDGYGNLEGAVGSYNYIYRAMVLGTKVVAINNSWGDVEASLFDDIIRKVGELGAVSCFAAGNASYNTDQTDDIIGSIDNPYVIVVAASNEKDELAGFSSYGKKNVTLAAPGADILSSVSYYNLEPAIYTDAQLTDIFGSNYTAYDSATVSPYTKVTNAADGIVGSYAATQAFGVPSMVYMLDENGDAKTVPASAVSMDSSTYFGKDGKSIKLSFDGKVGERAVFAIPFAKAATEQAPAVTFKLKVDAPAVEAPAEADSWIFDPGNSIMGLGVVSEKTFAELAKVNFEEAYYNLDYGFYASDDNNYWDALEVLTDKNANNNYLLLTVDCRVAGQHTVWLDDFGFTKGVKNEEKKFGKYAFYNGTSMATPYVTGAVALVSSMYPNYSADQLVNVISGSVRHSDAMNGKTRTAGVLDLSLCENPCPVISEVVRIDGKIVVKGNGLKSSSTVTVNGKAVTAKFAKGNTELSFDEKGYLNKKLTIKVSNDRGTAEKEAFFVVGKDFTYLGTYGELTANYEESVRPELCTTDGKSVYYLDYFNETDMKVVSLGQSSDINYIDNFYSIFDQKNAIEEGAVYSESGIVYSDGYIYGVFEKSDYSSPYKEVVFARINLEKSSVEKLANLPKAYNNIGPGTLAAYNGNIYMIGGYDYTKGEASKIVSIYNVASKKWTTAGNLPEGRMGGVCLQYQDKLVYALGNTPLVNGQATCPKAMIFDGKNWKLSTKAFPAPVNPSTVYIDNKEYASYDISTGLTKNGIFFTGGLVDGYGYSFTYNVDADSFSAVDLKYANASSKYYSALYGTVAGNSFYGIGLSEAEGVYEVYSADVESGLVKVTAEKSKKGTIKISDKNALPGQLVTVTASGNKGYAPTAIVVNGKTYKGSKATFRVTKNTKVSATYKKVTAVKKIKLNKTSATLKVGKTLKLKATVSPSKAYNKSVRWESSNTKYATVTSKGVVKAKKAGIGKTVTITCYAKDGSKVKAVCKIKIVK